MRPRQRRIAVPLLLLLAIGWGAQRCGEFGGDEFAEESRVLPGGFLVRPYRQLGPAPTPRSSRMLWHTPDVDADWSLEFRPQGHGEEWRTSPTPGWRRIAARGVLPHRVYRADLDGLPPGSAIDWRVRRDGEVVDHGEGRAPRPPGQPHRFAIFGDCGAGTWNQRAIARQTQLAGPDFLLIAGDIAYTRGRIREYRRRFWPIYDAAADDPSQGAPLLRSTLFIAAPGNHDLAFRDLRSNPDALAYFYYWDPPLNGPEGVEGGPLVPGLVAPGPYREAFLRGAGENYPRSASYSFDYGDAHWTVLDSNPYVDWSDPGLREWVARDLASAKGAAWRFVAMHHPPFNSSYAHRGDQRMRVLVDLFQAGDVDVVWSGHVHNYQRSFPLTFQADPGPDGRPPRRSDRIPGRWTLDREYDGKTRTRPRGIIYVVSGSGGAFLYNPEQDDDPGSWQPYTYKLIARFHSLTVADLDAETLTVRQLDAEGRELDRFVVSRSERGTSDP